MTTPVFVLRDNSGKLHPCQTYAEKVFCDGGVAQGYTVTDEKLTIGNAKDVDIRDKSIVLIDRGSGGTIMMARAFSDVEAFTKEIRPSDTTGGFTMSVPTYDVVFGFGLSGQTIDAPLTKASNFSYIAGFEATFGFKTMPKTYESSESNGTGLPPAIESDEPQIVDAEKPKIKVEIPTKPRIELETAPVAFKSESLFDTMKATIKNDQELADYVRFLVKDAKDPNDVIKIMLTGKADARSEKVLKTPVLVEKSGTPGSPGMIFEGNDKTAHDRAIAVQEWFSEGFKTSRNLRADTMAAFKELRYVVFVKGVSEDLPIVLPANIANNNPPQTIAWDNTIAGNTLERESYSVSATAEMEEPAQNGTWYVYRNGQLERLSSKDEATHLLFALKNTMTSELDWFVEDLDANRVVKPYNLIVDETDVIYTEPGFDTKPWISPALAAANIPEKTTRIDNKFNETTTRLDVKTGATYVSARYIPIKRDIVEKNDLSLEEKTYIKDAIRSAVLIHGRQQLMIHVNRISPEAAAGIRKFVVAHIPIDTISIENVVLIETHEIAKPVSITVGAIAGARTDLSKTSTITNEYMRAWYAAPNDAELPIEERSFPNDK